VRWSSADASSTVSVAAGDGAADLGPGRSCDRRGLARRAAFEGRAARDVLDMTVISSNVQIRWRTRSF